MNYENTAREILKVIEAFWNFFRTPKTTEEAQRLLGVWVYALKRKDYPDWVYLEAINDLAASARAGGSPPMPGDVLAAAKVVVDRVERDPERVKKLQKWRDQRLAERDEKIVSIHDRKKK